MLPIGTSSRSGLAAVRSQVECARAAASLGKPFHTRVRPSDSGFFEPFVCELIYSTRLTNWKLADSWVVSWTNQAMGRIICHGEIHYSSSHVCSLDQSVLSAGECWEAGLIEHGKRVGKFVFIEFDETRIESMLPGCYHIEEASGLTNMRFQVNPTNTRQALADLLSNRSKYEYEKVFSYYPICRNAPSRVLTNKVVGRLQSCMDADWRTCSASEMVSLIQTLSFLGIDGSKHSALVLEVLDFARSGNLSRRCSHQLLVTAPLEYFAASPPELGNDSRMLPSLSIGDVVLVGGQHGHIKKDIKRLCDFHKSERWVIEASGATGWINVRCADV